MKEIAFKNHKIKLYDSIDEMPIVNFQKYNKFILIDSGLGSDIDSVDNHLVNLAKLIKTDKEKASQELQNLRQTLHLIVSNISPKYLAFTALIHSIDNEIITDLSDDNLKKVLSTLNNIKHSKIIEFLVWFKKKLDFELVVYFPSEFGDNAKEKEIYDKLKQKTLLKLDEIINDKDNSECIDKIECFLFSLYKPKSFYGKKSVEIKYDKQFETACMCISQETNMNAKKMTVLEFYNALSELKKQAELKAKAYKKR